MATRATLIIILAAIGYLATAPRSAAIWCARYTSGASNCGFHSQQQCLETVRGVGGFCTQEGGGDEDRPARRAEKRKAEPKPKPKEVVKEEKRSKTVVSPPTPSLPAQQSVPNFQSAKALILSGQYEAGIAAMKAIGYDDHPDVASMIGVANAKLGRLNEAHNWFQRALAADPNHLPTLFSSGALYVMRGEADKARAELARIGMICGSNTCQEYQQLEQLISAKAR